MVSKSTEQARYLSDFERFEQHRAAKEPSWLLQTRQAAITRFAELGFPTTRQEEWKYTNVAPIVKTPFKTAGRTSNGLMTDTLTPFTVGKSAGARLVFVNGLYTEPLSSLHPLPAGVQVGSLAAAIQAGCEGLRSHLAQYASYQDQAFVALNTAFMEDGAFVYIPAGTVVQDPIQVLFISTDQGEPTLCQPRNLFLVEHNSHAAFIESYVGLENSVVFTNTITELVMGENSVVDHYKFQQESRAGFHIAVLQAQQERSSTFSAHSITLGGALVRNEVNTMLAGEGSECTLNGFYMATGQQLVDNHTRIDHIQPHCTSRELYKGVLGGKARGVFNGKIVVHKGARQTDATQTNKNLLLSTNALVDSKPQLEIFNNDVRCTHGSTTGQLDQDALFYLRTRGIDLQEARRLLIYAFANEIINRLTIESLRTQLDTVLTTQLQDIHESRE